MPKSVNKVILIGNVGSVDIKYTQSGVAIAALSLATSSVRTNKETQEKAEYTEWHKLKAFNRLAEIIGQYVTKGSKLYIEGALKTNKWTDQSGVDHYPTEIVINEMIMLGGGANAQQNTEPNPPVNQPPQAAPSSYQQVPHAQSGRPPTHYQV